MGFKEEIGVRSRGRDWRREREGEERERMEGGVVVEIGGEVKREKREREWREESRRKIWVSRERLEARVK
ncbi:hypothetical protein TIFTF001_011927 [Ficus carica]|uniref:Uncharacterized protein n=1 Tax=Ficus carica TaxID=3494 RepID=A0AA88A0V2_FICCA|nr:hypothetical protein TIFTF001_011927 [Ficus carica]